MADELKKELADLTRLAVVGVGSEIRNDDGVGIYVVNQLKEQLKIRGWTA